MGHLRFYSKDDKVSTLYSLFIFSVNSGLWIGRAQPVLALLGRDGKGNIGFRSDISQEHTL